MAVSGIVLLGFVVSHMIGNLHLYEGPLEIHEYAETLRDLGVHVVPRTWLLWAIRLVLIGAFVIHVHSAYTLSRHGPAVQSGLQAGHRREALRQPPGLPGRQLRQPHHAGHRPHRVALPLLPPRRPHLGLDLGRRLASVATPTTTSWCRWATWVSPIIYIAANVALAVHIFHGTYSLFQSLGINNPRINGIRRPLAMGLSALILVGNLSFPIAVQAGLIDQDNCEAPLRPDRRRSRTWRGMTQ